MLRPIWSYGAQIWCCAKPSQLKTIEAFQSISLRTITSAPWYISNHTLHKDLNIEAVDKLVKTFYKKFSIPTHLSQINTPYQSRTIPPVGSNVVGVETF